MRVTVFCGSSSSCARLVHRARHVPAPKYPIIIGRDIPLPKKVQSSMIPFVASSNTNLIFPKRPNQQLLFYRVNATFCFWQCAQEITKPRWSTTISYSVSCVACRTLIIISDSVVLLGHDALFDYFSMTSSRHIVSRFATWVPNTSIRFPSSSILVSPFPQWPMRKLLQMPVLPGAPSLVRDGYMDPAPVAQVRSRLTLKRQFVFGEVSMSI